MELEPDEYDFNVSRLKSLEVDIKLTWFRIISFFRYLVVDVYGEKLQHLDKLEEYFDEFFESIIKQIEDTTLNYSIELNEISSEKLSFFNKLHYYKKVSNIIREKYTLLHKFQVFCDLPAKEFNEFLAGNTLENGKPELILKLLRIITSEIEKEWLEREKLIRISETIISKMKIHLSENLDKSIFSMEWIDEHVQKLATVFTKQLEYFIKRSKNPSNDKYLSFPHLLAVDYEMALKSLEQYSEYQINKQLNNGTNNQTKIYPEGFFSEEPENIISENEYTLGIEHYPAYNGFIEIILD